MWEVAGIYLWGRVKELFADLVWAVLIAGLGQFFAWLFRIEYDLQTAILWVWIAVFIFSTIASIVAVILTARIAGSVSRDWEGEGRPTRKQAFILLSHPDFYKDYLMFLRADGMHRRWVGFKHALIAYQAEKTLAEFARWISNLPGGK